MSSFGQRLRLLREERGDKQDKIAKMLGISRAAISKYENGEREPDMKTILALTNYFNVTVDYMFGRSSVRGNPEYIQDNLKLIFGSKPVEQIKSEIENATGACFSIEELENYLSGKKIPSIKSIVAFAEYANVHPDFFYKKNTMESYVKEQENYEYNNEEYADKKIIEELIMDRKFIKLYKWMKGKNLSPEKIIDILENILDISKN